MRAMMAHMYRNSKRMMEMYLRGRDEVVSSQWWCSGSTSGRAGVAEARGAAVARGRSTRSAGTTSSVPLHVRDARETGDERIDDDRQLRETLDELQNPKEAQEAQHGDDRPGLEAGQERHEGGGDDGEIEAVPPVVKVPEREER
jgi:hypothetical protein